MASSERGNQTEVEQTERQQVSSNAQEESSVSNEHINNASVLQSNLPSEDNDPLTPAAETYSRPTNTEHTPTVDYLAIMIRPPIQEESDVNQQWDEWENFEDEGLCMANKAI